MDSIRLSLVILLTLSAAEPSFHKNCHCVRFWMCENGTELVNTADLIDVRSSELGRKVKGARRKHPMTECKNVMDVCCEMANIKKSFREKVTPSVTANQIVEKGCGIHNFNGIGFEIVEQGKRRARFGEFPWMVAILYRTLEKLDVYRCGGSLIHQKVVLTAAHCVYGIGAESIKIRAGEWNTQATDETFPHQDRSLETIILHENYDSKVLYNDAALLILNNPVEIQENVDVVCLAEKNNDFDSSRCTATGWGRDKFGKEGQHSNILKKVDLHMVPRSACQDDLRKARLGPKFALDTSFLCAKGSSGEDTCTGDGGSPLVCPLVNDPKRFVQIGIVSWGIGCGDYLPAVYAKVSHMRKWIDEQLMFHNFDNSVYQYELYNNDK